MISTEMSDFSEKQEVSQDEMIAVQDLLTFQNLPDSQDKAIQVCSGDLKTQHIIKADELSDHQLIWIKITDFIQLFGC